MGFLGIKSIRDFFLMQRSLFNLRQILVRSQGKVGIVFREIKVGEVVRIMVLGGKLSQVLGRQIRYIWQRMGKDYYIMYIRMFMVFLVILDFRFGIDSMINGGRLVDGFFIIISFGQDYFRSELY